jgi:two-component system cell cycle response regulator
MERTVSGRVRKADLERQNFDLRNLLEISKSLSSTLDYNILNDSILYTCLGALTVMKAALFSKKDIDATDFTLHRSFLGFEVDHRHSYSLRQDSPLIRYLGDHPGCHDCDALRGVAAGTPELDVLTRVAPRIVVPLKAKGAVNGILVLGEKIGGEPFDDRDRDYLESIAGLAAIAIHNASLFEMTTTDRMTKLKLKHYFLNTLQERLTLGGAAVRGLTLVMLDIDHFKRVNDTYGHLAGDETLIGVAAIVQAAVRAVDVAARYGGEEFIVLLPDSGSDRAHDVAERIRRHVEAATFVSGTHRVQVTVSLGVAEVRPSDASASDPVERADQALYASKQGGRNRTSVTS